MRPVSTQALTSRYVFILLLIALLSLFAYLTLHYIISRGSQLSRFVRLSDEQQNCAQRIAYFAMRLSQSGSASDHDVWRTRLKEETDQLAADEDEVVAKGGPLDLVAKFAPDVPPLYLGEPSHLDKEVRDYVALSRKIAAVPEGQLIFDDPGRGDHPGKKLQRIARRLQQGGRWPCATTGKTSVILPSMLSWPSCFLTLLTLVGAGIFVFRPMVKMIMAENQRLAGVRAQTDGCARHGGRSDFLRR